MDNSIKETQNNINIKENNELNPQNKNNNIQINYKSQNIGKRKACDIINYNKINKITKKKLILPFEELEMESLIKKNKVYLEKLSYKNNQYEIVQISEEELINFKCFLFLKNNKEFYTINDIIDLNDKIKIEIIRLNTFFLIDIIDKYNSNLNKTNVLLGNEARIINFIDKEQKIIYIHFIHNVNYLSEVMEKRNFKSYYISPEEYKIKIHNLSNSEKEQQDDSSNPYSISSSQNILMVFSSLSIQIIYKYYNTPILSEKNFQNRFIKKINKLKDLSNTAKYYYKNIDQQFILFDEYDNIITKKISEFTYYSKALVLYLYGPKGSSKSTFLIYSRNLLNALKINTLYLDVNTIKRKDNIERKRIILHELLYLFKDVTEMKEIEKKKIFHNIAYTGDDPLQYIYYFLQNLFQAVIFKDNKYDYKGKIIIIIDNIYDENNKVKESIESIISLTDKFMGNVKLIICGNGRYFNEKFIELYKSKCFQTIGLYQNSLILSIDKQNIEKQIKNSNEFLKYSLKFNYLYKDNQNILDFENKIIKEEEKYLEKYDFLGLFFCEELNNKKIIREDILKDKTIFFKIPLEYFEITENKDDKSLNFVFFHSVYQKSIKNKIGFEVKNGILTKLLKEEGFPSTFLGICFEKIITLLLMYNKLKIYNLFFEEKNIKEIKDLNILKDDNYNGPIFKIENKDKPILLLQENFYRPNYEIIILSKHNNKQCANFVQIGVDKNQEKIEKILNDLKTYENNYKKNIAKAFGFDSGDIIICLLFIFDLSHQEEKDYSSGTQICNDKKINYYLFSNQYEYFFSYNYEKKEKFRILKYIPNNLDIKDVKIHKEIKNIKKQETKKYSNLNRTLDEYFK